MTVAGGQLLTNSCSQLHPAVQQLHRCRPATRTLQRTELCRYAYSCLRTSAFFSVQTVTGRSRHPFRHVPLSFHHETRGTVPALTHNAGRSIDILILGLQRPITTLTCRRPGVRGRGSQQKVTCAVGTHKKASAAPPSLRFVDCTRQRISMSP